MRRQNRGYGQQKFHVLQMLGESSSPSDALSGARVAGVAPKRAVDAGHGENLDSIAR